MERIIWILVLAAAAYFAYWSTQLPPRDAATPTVTPTAVTVTESGTTPLPAARRIKMGLRGAGPEYFEDFDSALAYARSVRKPVLVVFGAGYCAACHRFLEVTCVSADVQKYYDRYVWVYLETQRSATNQLRKQYPDKPFHTIPHLWFIRWDGAFIEEAGYIPDPATFAAQLESVLSRLPSYR